MKKFKNEWLKAFEVYSPSTAHKHKAVINIQGRLKPLLEDTNVHLMTWIVSTSEEFYYQNSIYLTSKHKVCEIKTNQMLSASRTDFVWENRLKHFRMLGKGSFGTVFMAVDIFTNEKLAIKEIGPIGKDIEYILKATSEVLHERNQLLKANDSHFVVRFYASFQDISLRSYWLIFEFCIGSVHDFVDKIKLNPSSLIENFWSTNLVQSLYDTEVRVRQFDIQIVIFVFIFEICCGLDYLARRNIVHNDIKPENVLISQTGHFKITDLGVTERIRWIDRRSTVQFLNPSFIKDAEIDDSRCTFRGTIVYTDPEVQLFIENLFDKDIIYSKIKSSFFPVKNPNQDFITDLYSAGLSILDVMLFGLNPVLMSSFPKNIANRFNVDPLDLNASKMWRVRNIYDEDVHENFLYAILDKVKSPNNSSVIEFIKSILLPREIRALDYTKEIQMMKFKRIETRRHIDVEKLQELEYYKSRNITQYNVIEKEMPDVYLKMFSLEKLEKKPVVAENISNLAESLTKMRAVKYRAHRGMQVKMNCFSYQDPRFKL